jgi:hypothetical protein
MFLIDDPSNVPAAPAPTTPGTGGWFAEGDGASTTGTKVTNDWLNTVQAELLNIATAAGSAIDRTKAVNNQSIIAIRALIAAAQGNHTKVSVKTGAYNTVSSDWGSLIIYGIAAAGVAVLDLVNGTQDGQALNLLNNSAYNWIVGSISSLPFGGNGTSGTSFVIPPGGSAKVVWEAAGGGGFSVPFLSSVYDPAGSAATAQAAAEAYAASLQGNYSGVTVKTGAYNTVAADWGSELIYSIAATGTAVLNLVNGTQDGQAMKLLNNSAFNWTIGTISSATFGGSGTSGGSFVIPPGGSADVIWEAAGGGGFSVPYLSSNFLELANQIAPLKAASATGVSIGASYSGNASVSFTAPSNGTVGARGKLNLGAVAGNNITATLTINGTTVSADQNPLPQSHEGELAVTAGTVVTAKITVTTTAMTAPVLGTYSVTADFTPTP